MFGVIFIPPLACALPLTKAPDEGGLRGSIARGYVRFEGLGSRYDDVASGILATFLSFLTFLLDLETVVNPEGSSSLL